MVQLLISAMLGLLLSTAVLSLVFSAISANRLRHTLETIQENVAFAEYFMAKDMRSIGFKSCFDKPAALINNVSKGVVGRNLSALFAMSMTANSYKQSDSFVFSTVIHAGTEVVGDMATPHAQIDLVANNDLEVEQEVFITDCENADLFKISSMWNNRLSHDYSDNTDENLSVSYPQGTLLYPVSRISYKVEKGASGRPGLYRKIGEGNYQELISNVVQFRTELGIYSSEDTSINYKRVAKTVDSSQVASIRLYLLLSSAEPLLYKKMSYQGFNGQLIQADDLRLYKAYSIVMALHNSNNLLSYETYSLR